MIIPGPKLNPSGQRSNSSFCTNLTIFICLQEEDDEVDGEE